MKKVFILLVSLLAMMSASLSVKAQEVTITLSPGWNWISYPNAVAMEVNEALATFTPMEGDMVKGPFGFATYYQGQWTGGLTHFTPGTGYLYCSLRTEATSFVFAQASSVSVVTATPTDITATHAVVRGTVTLNEGTSVFLRGVCWGTEPNPGFYDNHTTEGFGTGSFTSTITDLSANTTYYVRAYAVGDYGLIYGNEVSFTTGYHAYVDLGLPSGTLWATYNVGAGAPEDRGDYFAWGETQPKNTYSWANYQHCNGSSTTLTKYCNNSSYGYNGYTDNLTTLLPEDDAATANWGNGWRMPTKEEWQELLDNTTVTCTIWNGVWGCLFTSTNGNNLFLPTAVYNFGYDVGNRGFYWSSSLDTDYNPQDAWDFCFEYYSDSHYMDTDAERGSGRSVRPVRNSCHITVTAHPNNGGTVTGEGTFLYGQSCTVTATPNQGYAFTNWTEDGTVVSTDATYTFPVEGGRNLVANFIQYVNLGLPSGLLWANCNVGADAPEGYGNYFAWGETQPKDTYNWSTYQYCNGGFNMLTKYCNMSDSGYNGFTDDLTTLLPEDDAVTANWGSDWRMPTKEEWQELLDNTTVTWTTRNGVSGRLFTASTGNSLFLPARGFLYNNGLLYYHGARGYYWSSSLTTGNPNTAWYLYFNSDNYNMSSTGSRYYGFSVRAVRDACHITVTAHPNNGGTVTGEGTFLIGRSCTVTATPNAGYTFVNWMENDEVVSTDATYTFTVNADRTLVANFTLMGTINGKFTINEDGDQVYFSQGNLQYQASTNTWKFAENQYDYVGNANSNISSTYSGWIDLFGWGTSGWNSGNTYYHPWDSDNSTGPAYGPPGQYNLTGSYANADWGVYNPISNGGNIANQWRTLTHDEWLYVFNTRSTASGIRYAKAKVNNVNGVILLPDDWDSSTYSLSNTNSSAFGFTNTLTASQWSTLEQAGAVFLPAAGRRNGTSVYVVGTTGYYWSASYYSSYGAYFVGFYDSGLSTNYNDYRYYGRSVRLVRVAE